MPALREQPGTHLEFAHLCDYFQAGIPDNIRIPESRRKVDGLS